MALWFNRDTGDLQFAYNAYEGKLLRRAGYRRVMTNRAARYFLFFPLKSRKTGKYTLEIINKDNPHHYPLINPENYEYYEDYIRDVKNLELLRKIDYRWAVAYKMLHDPQLLYEKLLKAIKRGKNIPWPALDFALSLLPPSLRRDVETQLIAKAFKHFWRMIRCGSAK